ncbi:hypothetical protein GCM10019059_03050 [Camelimonas fluminis]|nr:hypothetical protein GCM10019059_03050 [Camelimonas fluminis]
MNGARLPPDRRRAVRRNAKQQERIGMAQKDDATPGGAGGNATDEVKKGAAEIRQAADQARDDIADDLRQLREDIARLSETVTAIAASRGSAAASAVGDSVRAMKDNVFATAADACSAGADIAGSARQHAASFAGDVEDTVRRNPLGAILTSLGVGVLIGLMTRSR